jgi:hypothetical protein
VAFGCSGAAAARAFCSFASDSSALAQKPEGAVCWAQASAAGAATPSRISAIAADADYLLKPVRILFADLIRRQ